MLCACSRSPRPRFFALSVYHSSLALCTNRDTAGRWPLRDADLTVKHQKPLSDRLLLMIRYAIERIAIPCRWLLPGLVAAAFFVVPPAGADGPPQSGGRSQFSSSPVVWALPLHGGTIRASFVTPHYGMADVLRLAQAVDLRITHGFVWTSGRLSAPNREARGWGTDSEEEALRQVRAALAADSAIVVMANIDLRILPAEVLASVMQRVKNGAGLLVVNCESNQPAAFRAFLDAAVQQGIAHEWADPEAYREEWPEGLDAIRTGQVGKGRVTEIVFGGNPPFSHSLLPGVAHKLHSDATYLDSYFALLAKAVVWTAGREPLARIQSLTPGGASESEPSEDIVPVAIEGAPGASASTIEPALQPWTLLLCEPAKAELKVRSQVRQPGRDLRLVYDYTTPINPGAREYRGVYAPVCEGEYFLDVWLIRDGRVVDWKTRSLRGEAWPAIQEMALDKQRVSANDDLGVRLTIAPARAVPETDQGSGAGTVHVRAVDSYGRVVARDSVSCPAKGGKVTLTLRLADLMAPRIRVEALAIGRQPSTSLDWETRMGSFRATSVAVGVPPPSDNLRLGVTGLTSVEPGVREQCRALRLAGVSQARVDTRPEIAALAFDETLLPTCEIALYSRCDTADGPGHAFCPSDPAFAAQERERVRRAVGSLRAVGVEQFSFGLAGCGAAASRDPGSCPLCLAAFRTWLRDEYATLEALNASWGTQYSSWDQASPPPWQAVRSLGIHAPWIDLCRHRDRTLATFHGAMADECRNAGPGGRVGVFAGTAIPAYGGYGWRGMTRAFDALAVYDDALAVEKARSYGGGKDTALWLSANQIRGSREASQWPWYAVFHDMHGLWWPDAFAASQDIPRTAALDPKGDPLPGFSAVAGQVSVLNNGIGALLTSAERFNCRIGVYESRSSLYLNQVMEDGAPFAPGSSSAEACALALLRDLGFQCDFIAGDGADVPGEYRLLILPMARALSAAEARAIQEFVRQGGAVIADAFPGSHDEHGVTRAAPPLMDVFGMREVRATPMPSAPGTVTPSEGQTVSLGQIRPLCAAAPESAEARGDCEGTPLWLVNTYGAGRAVFLNHPFAVYGNPPADRPAAEALRRFVRQIAREAGAGPPCDVSAPSERPLAAELFWYERDDMWFAGALRGEGSGAPEERVRLRWNGSRHFYDLLSGSYLGAGTEHTMRVRWPEPELLAVLPHRVTGLDLEGPPEARAGERLPFTVRIGSDAPTAEHLVHVTLTPLYKKKRGPELLHYAQNVRCGNAPADSYIPLALNEAAGTYELAARDVVSGLTARRTVRVDMGE